MNQSLEQLEPDEPDELVYIGTLGSNDHLQHMNERFVAAMAAAIKAGLERPPRVGIDRTPGTKSPLYLWR